MATVLAKDAVHDNAVAVAFADLVATYTVADGKDDIEANRTYAYVNTANAKTSTFNDTTKNYEIEVEGDGYYLVINTTIPVDENGNVTEILATYDPESKGGEAPDGRKVRGTIHWVGASDCKSCEIRLYDRLFNVENPSDEEGVSSFADGPWLFHPAAAVQPEQGLEPDR